MATLPFPPDDDEPPPYEPSPEDLADYAAWSASIDPHKADYCPADFGHYCEDCDREMGEALARERDAMSDAWYRKLVALAEFPGRGRDA
jgi:hypothetical protein